MASMTISPTASGDVPAASASCAADRIAATRGVGSWPVGRVEAVLEMIRVATAPGQRTLTPIEWCASSRWRDSERPTMAYFDVVYRNPEPDSVIPAPDEVLTT